MDLILRLATPDDVPQVMRISKDHDLSGKTTERIKSEGFLVSAYPAEVYHRLLRHLFVATTENEIAGFTFTFMKKDLPPEVGKDLQRIEGVLGTEHDFFLFKQIGVALAHQHRGVGRALYQHHLRGLNIPAIAPIVTDPKNYNWTSTSFHAAMGFRQVESLKNDEGIEVSSLWQRDPPQP